MSRASTQVITLFFSFSLLLFGVPLTSASGGAIPQIPVVAVKGGCFDMGDTFGGGGQDEKPVHTVCLDDFFMGAYEVTQEQWQAVMGTNPSQFAMGGQYPVERVSWNEAQAFIMRLSRLSGRKWRLPTEAEWEYAARSGGRKQRFAGVGEGETPDEYAWYAANSGMKTHPVGARKPNDLGLYDMSGNVWEWVCDRYDRDYYRQSASHNPKGDPFGINRIMRGGAAAENQGFLRTSYRDYVAPDIRGDLFGLRLVLQAGR
ncbi:MAG: SUMF1/EgtB/PvdO family nonheme iron enzyme [Desulfuromonadales bacterium]|nr:SUMF1/EgtB/PvdO family nonheme iron enzyme [Desulfuromonadales bacterium]